MVAINNACRLKSFRQAGWYCLPAGSQIHNTTVLHSGFPRLQLMVVKAASGRPKVAKRIPGGGVVTTGIEDSCDLRTRKYGMYGQWNIL